LGLHRTDRYVDHLDQAGRIGLETPQEYLDRANQFAGIGQWQRVEDDLNQAVARAPGDDATVAKAALIYADKGRFERAGAWFARMKSLPSFVLASGWKDHARFLLLSGDQAHYRQFREAIWERYRSSPDPGYQIDLVFACAWGLEPMGDPEALVGMAQRACDHVLAGKNARYQTGVLLALGAAHLRAEAPSQAEPRFREAIARAPGQISRATGAAWLATCLLHQGRRDEATTWFDQADRFVRAQVPGGRPEREHSRPNLGEEWNWWWDLLLAWREAQGLLLDESFPADPFAP
jgi:tetratricopeptide (TPR) repeat protein